MGRSVNENLENSIRATQATTDSQANSAQVAIRAWMAVAELQPVGLSELARHLRMPKSTVQRALATLSEEEWISRPESQPRSWQTSPMVFSMASKALRQSPLHHVAAPHLRALGMLTRETIHLTTPLRPDVLLLVDRIDSPQELRMVTRIGSEIPLHGSASGKAFLAASDDAFLSDYLKRHLEQLTPQTLTNPQELQAEIDRTRLRGYSVVVDEREVGVSAIGAAITPLSGRPVGCVSVSMPTVRFPSDPETIGHQAVETARKIAEDFVQFR